MPIRSSDLVCPHCEEPVAEHPIRCGTGGVVPGMPGYDGALYCIGEFALVAEEALDLELARRTTGPSAATDCPNVDAVRPRRYHT